MKEEADVWAAYGLKGFKLGHDGQLPDGFHFDDDGNIVVSIWVSFEFVSFISLFLDIHVFWTFFRLTYETLRLPGSVVPKCQQLVMRH